MNLTKLIIVIIIFLVMGCNATKQYDNTAQLTATQKEITSVSEQPKKSDSNTFDYINSSENPDYSDIQTADDDFSLIDQAVQYS